jgi:hypothetical protein
MEIVIGNYMTEAVFRYQDPRYFRRGAGSGWTHHDSRTLRFNNSEIVGSVAAFTISDAYYADNRTAGDAAAKLGFQIQPEISSRVLAGSGAEAPSSQKMRFMAIEDEISEVDERRHRTNCRLWRATLRKHL